jgi:CubicO group peptidase (beta-lactamase class C family)
VTRRSLLFSGVSLALRRDKLDQAVSLVQSKVDSGEVAAAVLHVQSGKDILNKSFGAARTPDAVFLLASISKPMTATAVMLLSDRKQLSITDPVQKFIPEFRGGGRERITIRNVLTHTSGLPDMLPQNDELRKRHAPLKDFVAATCATPLLFSPGTKVHYQSMGILLAAEIVQRITHRPLPEFLRDQVYEPLDMRATSLGLGARAISSTMQCQVDDPNDWDWNSTYWRNLASPWGGAHSTAANVSRFLRSFQKVLKPGTAASMTTNQTAGLNLPWGLGWKLEEKRPRVFGHSGSTGTLAWLDPEKDLSFVLLTTKPAAVSEKILLTPASDLISGAG